MEPIKIHINWPFSDDLVNKVRQISHRLEVTVDEKAVRGQTYPVPVGTEILYASYMLPEADAAPDVKWIQVHSAGVNKFMNHPLYQNDDIVFTNVSGIHAVPMAEHTLGQILHHNNRMAMTLRDESQMRWPSNKERWDTYAGPELRGQTLGLVGYGSISREIARLASAFGMQVLALKRDLKKLGHMSFHDKEGTGDPYGEIPERFYPPEALHSMLAECDYVVLALPLNHYTQHLIDEDALIAMKPSSVLINVARGQIVDEQALVEALDTGEIAGASLDVFEKEPLSQDNPLWEMPNVVVTPHISSLSDRYDERAIDLFCENVRRYLSGASLLNVVNRSLGY